MLDLNHPRRALAEVLGQNDISSPTVAKRLTSPPAQKSQPDPVSTARRSPAQCIDEAALRGLLHAVHPVTDAERALVAAAGRLGQF
jgi:hypothetical protein